MRCMSWWIVWICMAWNVCAQTASGSDASTTTVHGPVGTAVVVIDSFGVARINASNERDLFFAQGFADALLRLWQLEFQKRETLGTLSAVLGADFASSDEFFATMDFGTIVAADVNTLDPITLQTVTDYANGINAGVAALPQLPPEFALYGAPAPQFSPADVLLTAKLFASALAENALDIELPNSELLDAGLPCAQLAALQRTDPRFPVVYPSSGFQPNCGSVIPPGDLPPPAPICPPSVSSRFLNDPVPQTSHYSRSGTLTYRLKHPKSGAKIPLFGRPPRAGNRPRDSNNWAVSGAFTVSGSPLWANDPHLDYAIPNDFVLHVLSSPTYAVKGGHVPGIPGVTAGRTDTIAYGSTNAYADVQDLFLMQDVDHKHYMHNGQPVQYTKRDVVIKVKGAPNVRFTVLGTVYGPVVAQTAAGQNIALRWTALDPNDGTMASLIAMPRATSFSEYLQAAHRMDSLSLNFAYADIAGDIAMVSTGKVPLRVSGDGGQLPVPGTGPFDWTGFLAKSALPSSHNPSAGYVASANNNLGISTPLWTSNDTYDLALRAQRISCLLEAAGSSVNTHYFKKMQGDVLSTVYFYLLPALQRIPRPLGGAGSIADALLGDVLAWDGFATIDSTEASLFNYWRICLSNVTLNSIVGDRWTRPEFLRGLFGQGPCDPYWSVDCDNYSATCFLDGVDFFGGSVDSIPTWGAIHPALFPHDGPSPPSTSWDRSIPAPGDPWTIDDADMDNSGDLQFTSTGGPSVRLIADMSCSALHAMIAVGQSGDPNSSHYDDLLMPWRNVHYLEL